MQVDPTELNVAIAEAQRAGRLTERLAVLGMQVARGYLSSEKFSGYSAADREDIFSAFTVSFVRGWQKLDPDGNPHAYLSTMAANCWRMHERSAKRRLRREHAKAEAAYAEETERLGRFIRAHTGGLGEAGDVLTMREFTERIKGRTDRHR
jgi:DNA-directed RNA polymerase specialized sigma24 family protein